MPQDALPTAPPKPATTNSVFEVSGGLRVSVDHGDSWAHVVIAVDQAAPASLHRANVHVETAIDDDGQMALVGLALDRPGLDTVIAHLTAARQQWAAS